VRFFESVRPLRRLTGLKDAAAGLTLAAMNIPQALGYAGIAQMPVVTGLYALLLPPLAFAMFGSSRFLVVSADSATAAILAGGLAGLAPAASGRYVALAGIVALLTALMLLAARLLKLGFIADFLSQTVLVGFLTGVGFQVGIAVLGKMLGLPVASRRTMMQLIEVCTSLKRVNIPTVIVSALVLTFALLLRRFAPKFPGALLAVLATTWASEFWHLSAHGIATVGAVAAGLPRLHLPTITWKQIELLISLAASCTVMIITQSAATARAYATRHEQTLDENADLTGLSAANAAAGLSGAFVVNGSPTQTAMVEGAGAQSQLAQISTSAVVCLVLLFLARPLQYLPQCVLGVLVFMVAIHLIDLKTLRAIRKESPGEFVLATTAAAVVVFVGVEQGIVVAMVLSLLRIVRHTYHPHTGVMVSAEKGIWNLLPVAPGVCTEPGLAIYRFGATLFYANANQFSEELQTLTRKSSSPLRWIVVDAEAMTHIDYSAARVVIETQKRLAAEGIVLGFTRAPWDLRSDLERHHVAGVVGEGRMFLHLHDAVSAFHHAEGEPLKTG
jgi:sulfate permease, SulP family